jgi:hypothetical protein
VSERSLYDDANREYDCLVNIALQWFFVKAMILSEDISHELSGGH